MHEILDPLAACVQIKNDICHQLTGAVIGDVAAPLDLNHRDAMFSQKIGRNLQVFSATPASQRKDRRVFEQQQHVICNITASASSNQGMLQGQGFAVVDLFELYRQPHFLIC